MVSEKKQKRSSIASRWAASCLTVIIATVAAAVILFSVLMLRRVGGRPAILACLGAAVTGAVLILVLCAVNRHFIESITGPVKALDAIARRIAQGSYGIQAEKPGNDEIGDLFDSINDMSSQIAQAERMQTEFISSVSHELRTPLTAITGWSETLAYDEAIQGDSRRGIQIISKEASRLTKMVEELLEFTRIQAGRFTLDLQRIDIAPELEDAVFTYGRLLSHDGTELIYEPPEGELPEVEADPERLKQVFLNILDNAAKYGRGKSIEIGLKSEAGYVIISVRDHGSGIPEAELPHVKERFYKGSGRERGSGIGLSVCDEIISRHCGRLEIGNAPGGGTLVSICLPAAKQIQSEMK